MTTLPKDVEDDGTVVWEVYRSVDGYSVRFADGTDLGQWATPETAAEFAAKRREAV